MITADNLRVAPNLRQLYAFMMENMYIQALRGFDVRYLSIFSRDVLDKLREGNASWEEMVPAEVASLIKARNLFGYEEGTEFVRRLAAAASDAPSERGGGG